MTKADLVAAVAEKAGIPKRKAAGAVGAVFGAVSEALARGEAVKLAGFGTFAVRERAARKAKSPRTGETVEIPARKAAVFRPASALKEKVK